MPLIYYRIVANRSDKVRRDSALAWIRDAISAHGLFGALRLYYSGLVELLRDLTPIRRKSRYGDIDFDFEHEVDTTWATVSLRTRVREWLRGVQYQASEAQLFHEILAAVPAPLDGFTFIDLGSGKGRALLMASGYPFARIIGLELLSELNAIAVQNIARFKSDEQKCFAIESHAADARRYEFPNEPTVLYLFNPFPEYVLEEVLMNLRVSLVKMPRSFYVIYHNLVHERVFERQPWLHQVLRTHQYAVYEAGTRGQGLEMIVGV